jgi:hypothetical protein
MMAFAFTFVIIIPLVSIFVMNFILHRKLDHFQNLMTQPAETRSAAAARDETLAIENDAFNEIQKYNIYLNYLNDQYPQQPDSMLYNKQSNSLALIQRNIGGNKSLFRNLTYSIRISAMIASISKYFIIFYLPYIIVMMIYKIYQKKSPTVSGDMVYLFEGLLKLSEVVSFTNFVSHFFIYLLYGKSFRCEHKKIVLKVFQPLYYVLISLVCRPFQTCHN